MLDQIKQIIEQVSSKEISAQGIPSNLTSSVVEETGSSIVSGFKNSISEGNLSQITDLFKGSGNVASNGIVTSIVNNLISSLSGKLGIDGGIAKTFASAVVPTIVSSLVSKSKDSKDSSFQVTDLISSLSGGDSSNTGDLLKTLSGLVAGGDKSDNKNDLGGAISAVKNLFK